MWRLSASQISPWQPVVETNLWLFCRIQSNLAPCDSLYAKNAFTVNTHVILDHHYCTHANVSGRNHFVCLACSMFCAAPPLTLHRCTHTHFCYWAPEFFFSHSFFVRPGQPRTMCGETPTLTPTTLRHRMPVWSLSESFMCSFYLYGQKLLSSFRTLPVQNSAQLFPPQLIWNSNRHTVSLRSMEYVAILSRLSSDFGKKRKQQKKRSKIKPTFNNY